MQSTPLIVDTLGGRFSVSHTFLSGELQCLPCGNPRNLCANVRIRSLATHSLYTFDQPYAGHVRAVVTETTTHVSVKFEEKYNKV